MHPQKLKSMKWFGLFWTADSHSPVQHVLSTYWKRLRFNILVTKKVVYEFHKSLLSWNTCVYYLCLVYAGHFWFFSSAILAPSLSEGAPNTDIVFSLAAFERRDPADKVQQETRWGDEISYTHEDKRLLVWIASHPKCFFCEAAARKRSSTKRINNTGN